MSCSQQFSSITVQINSNVSMCKPLSLGHSANSDDDGDDDGDDDDDEEDDEDDDDDGDDEDHDDGYDELNGSQRLSL